MSSTKKQNKVMHVRLHFVQRARRPKRCDASWAKPPMPSCAGCLLPPAHLLLPQCYSSVRAALCCCCSSAAPRHWGCQQSSLMLQYWGAGRTGSVGQVLTMCRRSPGCSAPAETSRAAPPACRSGPIGPLVVPADNSCPCHPAGSAHYGGCVCRAACEALLHCCLRCCPRCMAEACCGSCGRHSKHPSRRTN